MARDSNEVLIGPGTLYTAPVGTAYPADPSVAPSGTWIDIGYSEEGWSFNVGRDFADVEVAEEIDPLDILVTKRDIHLVGASAQGSLENLKIALGGGTITTLTAPNRKKLVPLGTSALDRVALLFRGNAPKVAGVAKVRDVQMPNAVSVGAIEMASKKAPDKTIIGMDFRLVKVSGTDIFTKIDLT